MEKKYPEANEITEFIFSGNDDNTFDLSFHSAVYSKLVLSILQKIKITPDSVRCAAFHHLILRKKSTASVMLIDKNLYIKEIKNLFVGYRHELTEFTTEIIDMCRRHKVKKCVVIYNFNYRKDGYLKELADIDMLFKSLSNEHIILTDVVKLNCTKAMSVISPLNKKGYL